MIIKDIISQTWAAAKNKFSTATNLTNQGGGRLSDCLF